MTHQPEGAHATALEALGLVGDVQQRLTAYLDILAFWARRVNLSGARTAQERVAILVAPAVPIAPYLQAGRLVDVGSGNGSPGLVLGLLRPDLDVVLIEPRMKRWAFLREAARVSGRSEIEVVRTRYQDYGGPPAETVTVRALAVQLSGVQHIVRAGGDVIVFGAAPGVEDGFEAEAVPGTWGPGVHRFRRRGTGRARARDGDVSRET